MSEILLRPFNGCLEDAQGILAVDRVTFNDCPYLPEKIVRLLAGGEQRAWVAEAGGSVVGFVSAFPTRTLQAENWEIDLLAVHPQHRGQGIGTALIKLAVAGATGSGATLRHGSGQARARAAVAVRNRASRRAFEAAGFQSPSVAHHLMRCDVAGATARPPVPGMEAVRPQVTEADARGVLRLAPALPLTVSEVIRLANVGGNTLLVVERDGRVSAFVELVRVQTLLYAGAWVEMLVTPALSPLPFVLEPKPWVLEPQDQGDQGSLGQMTKGHIEGSHPDEAVPLIAAAVEWVKAEGLDEIGGLVAAGDWRLRQAFAGEGFLFEGDYLVMTQALP